MSGVAFTCCLNGEDVRLSAGHVINFISSVKLMRQSNKQNVGWSRVNTGCLLGKQPNNRSKRFASAV